jgi:hypothetical protein
MQKVRVSFLAVTLIIPVAISTFWLVSSSFRGLDFSDEGMYLLSASANEPLASFHNPFGTYTGLLFDLSLGQVWLFRTIGICLLAGSGSVLGFAIYRYIDKSHKRSGQALMIAVGSTIGIFYYATGLMTPSYNWLNLFALVLGAIACLMIADKTIASSYKLMGVGFLLAASSLIALFAKFSSAFGIISVALVITWFSGRNWRDIKILSVSFVCASVLLGVVHHFFIESWSISYMKYSRGKTSLEILDPAYNTDVAVAAFKIDFQYWINTVLSIDKRLFLGVLFYLFVLFLFNAKRLRKMARTRGIVVFALSLLIVTYVLIRTLDLKLWAGHSGLYINQMWAVSWLFSCGLGLGLPLYIARGHYDHAAFILKRQMVVVFVCISMACLYAIGSGNGFLRQLTGASGFILISAVCIPLSFNTKDSFRIAFMIACVGLYGAVETTNQANLFPYRQTTRKDQTEWLSLGKGRGSLLVAPELASTVTDLRSQLKSSSWKKETPLLDLTSYSAGLVYLLEAKPPITIIPTVGGYTTVDDLMQWSVEQALKDDKETWKEAWLLTNSDASTMPTDGRPNPNVTRLLDKIFPDDYRLVASTAYFSIWEPKDD